MRRPVALGVATVATFAAWEADGNPDVLSSFVRPLLVPDGECFATTAGLPTARYCRVLDQGRFVVLGRVRS